MATNPDLNIVDTNDNLTLLQLQQAQQIAVANGNIVLANQIGNAIQAYLLTGSTLGISGTSGTAGMAGVPVTAAISFAGSAGTAGGNVNLNEDLCPNPTYRIGKLKELQVGRSYNANPDFAELSNAKQCVLIGEVLKCCPSGETFVGWVVLGYAISSEYYEDCPDGGKRPVIKQYYDLNQISIGGFVLPTVDNLGLNTVADPFITSEERLSVYRGKWSNECSINIFTNPNTPLRPKVVFDTFEEYFNSTYANLNGITFENESRQIQTSIVIYKSVSKNFPRQVDSNIFRGVPATCNYEGTCVKTNVPDRPEPCTDTWRLGTTFSEEEFNRLSIPTGYVRIGNTQFQIIGNPETVTSNILETVPNNPCYKGYRQVVRTTSSATYTYEYRVSQDCIFTKVVTVTRVTESSPVWVQQVVDESKRNLKECQCDEIFEDAGVLLDPSDPCGCKQYNIVKVKIKCPGETQYSDSTEIYTDGLPLGLNLPVGHKLDPFVPFSLRADCNDEPIKIYHPLVLGKDIVEGKVTANTRGLFNLSQSMSCYNTSSLQSSASKEYYYEVSDCDCDSTPYFAVAYGNVKGSGSLWSVGETNDTSTRAVYSQYRLIALEEPERKFKFYDNGTLSENDDIYAINFYRNGLSDRIDPGNFEIGLHALNGNSYANNVYTGSNVQLSGSTVHTFIDNSNDRSDLSTCSEDPYISYDIVSGSLDNGIHDSGTGSIDTNPNITTYGKFYPNLGIMIFDPSKLNSILGFNTVTGSNIAGDNAYKLYTSISGSGTLGTHIKARNVKYKTTNHYFVRVSPPNANYSNNPTFVSDTSTGKLLNVCFQKEPVTYVTSVGLYNNKRELLAIAKLSKPIKKTPDDDLLIKIRLNW